MGRRHWGTEEQLTFLESFVAGLDLAKVTCTLKTEYERISVEFMKKWPTQPSAEEMALEKDPKKLQVLADNRRRSVSYLVLALLGVCADQFCQQIREWYKTHHKGGTQPQPKVILDLTGKTQQKPTPYQLHHAYSIRHYREAGSPLQTEVDDLWERRADEDVIKQLSPFSKAKDLSTGSRLNFHNAVMRWKCSSLDEEELQEMEEWIASDVVEKEQDISKPWKAGEGEDELSVENEYIQRYALLKLIETRDALD